MITGTFTTGYGVVSVAIDAGSGSRTCEISAIGSISYEFDITPDQVEITRLMAIYTRMDVTWLASTTDGTELYDLLIASIATSVPATVTIAKYDGTTEVFPFRLSANDVSLSERESKCKTSFAVAINPALTVQDVWDNIITSYAPEAFIYRSGGTDYNAVSAKRWIQVALWMLRGGTGVITDSVEFASVELAGRVVDPADFLTYTYDDIDVVDPALDTKFCLCCIDTAGIDKNAVPVNGMTAIEALQSMAGYEGGVFGFGFSTVFYVNRSVDYSSAVSIGYDQVLDLNFARSFKSYRNINVGTISNTYDSPDNHIPSFPTQTVQSAPLNPNAEKSVLLTFYPGFPVMQLGQIDSTVHLRVDGIASTTAESANLGFLSASLDCYLPSFPATGNLTIECVIYGFGAVKPWEVFQFDSTVPARYQGKLFRINSVSYDFIANKTKIRAYEVN
jgi:hypothetical protein